MNETLKYIILFIVTFILYSTITSSTYIFSIINTESVVNEDNKEYITPIYITNFIIQILFILFMLINNGFNYTIFEYVALIVTTVGIIISLIYIAERDN